VNCQTSKSQTSGKENLTICSEFSQVHSYYFLLTPARLTLPHKGSARDWYSHLLPATNLLCHPTQHRWYKAFHF